MVVRILFTVALTITGILLSGYLGRAFVSPSDGLTGGAVVFWFLAGGLIVGCVAGIIFSRTLSDRVLVRACIITVALTIVLVVTAYFQFTQAPQEDSQDQKKPTTIPIKLNQKAQQPMGLGMASPFMASGKPLYIYSKPEVDQLPVDLKPIDSITFVQRQGFIDIATAPPNLVPEVLKLDYNVFYFRAVSLSRYWVEVIINITNGHTVFLDREAIEYLSWPDFFLNVFSVERLDDEKNPVRARPMDTGSVLASGPNISLSVISVHGDWLEVSTNGLADRMPPYGYIRWRDGDKLLVTYSLFS